MDVRRQCVFFEVDIQKVYTREEGLEVLERWRGGQWWTEVVAERGLESG